MPETIGLPLPQTFLDAQNVGNTRSFFSWVNHWNYKKYMPVTTEDNL